MIKELITYQDKLDLLIDSADELDAIYNHSPSECDKYLREFSNSINAEIIIMEEYYPVSSKDLFEIEPEF